MEVGTPFGGTSRIGSYAREHLSPLIVIEPWKRIAQRLSATWSVSLLWHETSNGYRGTTAGQQNGIKKELTKFHKSKGSKTAEVLTEIEESDAELTVSGSNVGNPHADGTLVAAFSA